MWLDSPMEQYFEDRGPCYCSACAVSLSSHWSLSSGISTTEDAVTYLTPEKAVYFWPPFLVHPITGKVLKETWVPVCLYTSPVQDLWTITPEFPSALLPMNSPTASAKLP